MRALKVSSDSYGGGPGGESGAHPLDTIQEEILGYPWQAFWGFVGFTRDSGKQPKAGFAKDSQEHRAIIADSAHY